MLTSLHKAVALLCMLLLFLSSACFADWDQYKDSPAAETSGVETATIDVGPDTPEEDVSPDTPEEDVAQDTPPDTLEEDTSVDADLDGSDEDTTSDVVETDVIDEDTSPDVGPDPCDSFAPVQETYYVRAFFSEEIQVRGGSGDYTWSFVDGENNSGAVIDPALGLYLAGNERPSVDQIRIEDTTCARAAVVTVHVVDNATVLPALLEIEAGGEVCFRVLGGGQSALEIPDAVPLMRWERVQAGSGDAASLDEDGCYRAGEITGEDIIQATDLLTGQVATSLVRVLDQTPTLRSPIHTIILPANESMDLRLEGGSHSYTYTFQLDGGDGTQITPSPTSSNALTLSAGAPGQGTVLVQDAFIEGVELELKLSILQRTTHPFEPYGTHSDAHDLQHLGDVNGDGLHDVLLSGIQHNLNGTSSGAAFLYLGQELGENGTPFPSTPSQILPGRHQSHFFGVSSVAADFNRDGCNDVAIGAYGADPNGGDSGEVLIWLGCQDDPLNVDGFAWYNRLTNNLPSNPSGPLAHTQTLEGQSGSDLFGWDVTAADFNNDGFPDLVVTAYQDEDPEFIDAESGSTYSNIGRISVFFWDPAVRAFPETPEIILNGQFLDENGEFTSGNNYRLGRSVAAADLNDDGCADLLAGAPLYNSNRGGALLFLSKPDPTSPGGCVLHETPALTFIPGQNEGRSSAYLGWEVAFQDLNGDCIPDPIVMQLQGARLGGDTSAAGSANIFFTSPDWSHNTPRRIERDTANMILQGDSWDQSGMSIDFGDFDGDGIQDVLTGNRYAESEGTTSDVGEIRIYRGLADDSECTASELLETLDLANPVIIANGPQRRQDQLGARILALPDMNNDGLQDWMAFAPRGPARGDADDLGDHGGVLYWGSGSGGYTNILDATPLSFPLFDSGDLFGWHTEPAGDLNGDGYNDFLASAYQWDFPGVVSEALYVRYNAGGVFVFFGGPDGISSTPDALFAGYMHHTESDLFGYSMSTGDMNGDGALDVVIGAPFEDNTGGTYCRTECGTAGRNDVGAAYIYRGGGDMFARATEPTILGMPTLRDPDVVVCGPQANSMRITREVRSGFDLNGDGRDDLAMSNWNWNGARGRVWLWHGREFAETTQVYCLTNDAPALENRDGLLASGSTGGDNLGRGLAGADFDADGCADLVAGAVNGDPPGRNNAGYVRIWMGWGGEGCRTEPIEVFLHTDRANDNLGWRTVTGDFNGDGVPDIAATSSGFGSTNIGAVLVWDGAQLQPLLENAAQGDWIAVPESAVLAVLEDPAGASNVNFGLGLQSMKDTNDDGRDDIIIGAQLSSLSGNQRSGAAFIFYGSDDPNALAESDVWIGGESQFGEGRFGFSVSGSSRFADGSGGVVLSVGAYQSEDPDPHTGSMGTVYFGHLEAP